MNDELDDRIRSLNAERARPMPRWKVRPDAPDSPEAIRRRRVELLTAEAEWRASLPVQVVRGRQTA